MICVQAHHLDYTFDKYYLHAQGAFSKISLKTDRNTKYELYLPSSENNFNRALAMLLDTVNLFVNWLVNKLSRVLDGKQVRLYPIEGDKIHNSSVRYSSDGLE